MINLIFTASVVRKTKGRYIAHAEEFPVIADPATTQRGAVKKLKVAVADRLRKAADRGTLIDFLEDAGYAAELLHLNNIKLEANIYAGDQVSIPVARQLPVLDR